MPGTDAGPVARQDFHIEVDKAFQGPGILVVDFQIVNAKIAFFGFFSLHSVNCLLEGDVFDADLVFIDRLFRDLYHRFAALATAAHRAAAALALAV